MPINTCLLNAQLGSLFPLSLFVVLGLSMRKIHELSTILI